MRDPVQHAFESEGFQVQYQVVAVAFRQACLMNPNPQVAKDQRHGDEQQPQVGIACARIDTRLAHLPIAGFDAKPLAISLADLGGRARHTLGGE